MPRPLPFFSFLLPKSTALRGVFLGSSASISAYWYYYSKNNNMSSSPSSMKHNLVAFCDSTDKNTNQAINTAVAGHWIDDLPEYSLDDVTERSGTPGVHNGRVWIFFRSGVYDITDFLALHPGGGKRLMLAAGSGIEPFWKQFTVHDKPEVFEQLEKFRIGNLKGTKGQKFEPLRDPNKKEDDGGMWWNEPKDRDSSYNPFSTRPYNAECTKEALAHNSITPNDKFFIRSHLPVPSIDREDFCLDISGIGMKNDDDSCPTLEELFKRYGEQDQVVTIQCGGNRRAEAVKNYPDKPIKGIKWKEGAIGTAKWSGASMRQIILDFAKDPKKLEEMAKKHPGKYHVHFEGADQDVLENYEISVPLELALDPNRDALVAWKMNGQPIPPDHGYPLRAVVPGTVGSRNCKWLQKISIQAEEAHSDWQRKDYRRFPDTEKDATNAHKYPAVNDMPIQVAITDTLKEKNDNSALVKGFAYCGGGKEVVKVEVSYDGGKTFPGEAHLSNGGIEQKKGHRWAWKQFYAPVTVPKEQQEQQKQEEKKMNICVRGIASDGSIQPEVAKWNFRGMFYNGYSCVEI